MKECDWNSSLCLETWAQGHDWDQHHLQLMEGCWWAAAEILRWWMIGEGAINDNRCRWLSWLAAILGCEPGSVWWAGYFYPTWSHPGLWWPTSPPPLLTQGVTGWCKEQLCDPKLKPIWHRMCDSSWRLAPCELATVCYNAPCLGLAFCPAHGPCCAPCVPLASAEMESDFHSAKRGCYCSGHAWVASPSLSIATEYCHQGGKCCHLQTASQTGFYFWPLQKKRKQLQHILTFIGWQDDSLCLSFLTNLADVSDALATLYRIVGLFGAVMAQLWIRLSCEWQSDWLPLELTCLKCFLKTNSHHPS